MTHERPGPGCEARVPTEMLACRKHWFQVSKAVRNEVWSAYRALERGGGDDPVAAEERHERAMQAAIAEMRA